MYQPFQKLIFIGAILLVLTGCQNEFTQAQPTLISDSVQPTDTKVMPTAETILSTVGANQVTEIEEEPIPRCIHPIKGDSLGAITWKFDFALSPDGEKIAHLGPDTNIYLLDLDNMIQSVENSPAQNFFFGVNASQIMWSPDSNSLAYISRIHKVHLIPNIEHDQTIQLTEDQTNWMVWSPDGQKIAYYMGFSSDNSGDQQSEVFIMDLDEGSRTRLTKLPGQNILVSWSPDGKLLLVESTRDGYQTSQIFSISIDEDQVNLYAEESDCPVSPTWSPDGKFILYSARIEENWEIFIVNVNNGQISRVTATPELDEYAPVWSHDGTKIAFAAQDETGSLNSVYVANVDGSELIQLTEPNEIASFPAWLPDNSSLVFALYDEVNDTAAIEMMKLDSFNRIRLTTVSRS